MAALGKIEIDSDGFIIVIELFVRSRTVNLAATDAETLGHACTSPGAQMRAASATRALKIYPQKDLEALERVRALADALAEKLIVWDLATFRGRRVARRRGVRETPAVTFGSNEVDSVEGFEEKVSAVLRTKEVASG